MLKIHFSQNDMRNMMLIQQTLIQYLLQKKNLCEIFKVLTIWGNINLFIRPQHQETIRKKKMWITQNGGSNKTQSPEQNMDIDSVLRVGYPQCPGITLVLGWLSTIKVDIN